MSVAGFVGANPAALLGVAETLEQYALRIRAVGHAVEQPLLRVPLTAADLSKGVSHIESAIVAEAEELRWRAQVIDAAQDIGVSFGPPGTRSSRIEFASLAIFDLGAWEEAYRQWRTSPDPATLLGMSPAQVSARFAAMSPSLATTFACTHPNLVGALDGASPALRYLANEVLIEAKIDELHTQLEELESSRGRSWVRWLTSTLYLDWIHSPALADVLTEHYQRQIDEYQRWLDEERQILLFDPAGDGRVIEAFGDVVNAGQVGVVVPGMSNDLGNFSQDGGGFRQNALRLYESSLDLGGQDVATIAWLGYNSPDNIGAATRSAASEGAPALRRFLDGIDPQGDKEVTVVAHSYGSVVAGLAAGDGLAVDNLVFVGSPGTTLDHADDAILRSGGRVWVALADDDPIGLGISPRELPPVWVPPPLMPIVFAIDLGANGPEELWHGANPANSAFGADRMATDGSSGHSGYFEAESLLNLARIVQGLYADVELVS